MPNFMGKWGLTLLNPYPVPAWSLAFQVLVYSECIFMFQLILDQLRFQRICLLHLCGLIYIFLYFFLFFKILFIFREGKGGREERNSSWLPLSHPRTWPANQAYALTGNCTHILSICRLALNPLSQTSRG